jgi:molybdate transport repressor ModE-like protein
MSGNLISAELKLAGRLDARFFALLQALQDTGSINKAARTAGLSYKGAWLLLETACNLANETLLETATGGAGGGGTRLTPAALGLLRLAHAADRTTRIPARPGGTPGSTTGPQRPAQKDVHEDHRTQPVRRHRQGGRDRPGVGHREHRPEEPVTRSPPP